MWRVDSYLVFDFETSGLDTNRDRIIQVGYCRVEKDGIVESDGWLVRQDVRIDPEAKLRHGLSEAMLAERGMDPQASLDRLLQVMQAAPSCMGHNIHSFDLRFLNAECRRLGRPMPSDDGYIDTAALFKGWRMRDGMRQNESNRAYAQRILAQRVRGLKFAIPACLQEFGIKLEKAKLHDAANDSIATHHIYQAMKRCK